MFHGMAGARSPSLDARREGVLSARSDPEHSTAYAVYIDVINANAMETTVSVTAMSTVKSVINKPLTGKCDQGQTYTPTIVYDTVAMGNGSLPATPPVQSDTAAYTQVK